MAANGGSSPQRALGLVLIGVVVLGATIAFGGLTLSAAGVEPLPDVAQPEDIHAIPTTSNTPAPDQGPPVVPLNESAVERSVHEQVNRERVQRGLPPLRVNHNLRAIAREHSLDMATRDYVNHSDPDGETMADRYAAAGIDCRVATMDGGFATGAENIILVEYPIAFPDGHGEMRELPASHVATEVVRLWLNSPAHRANLLKPYWNTEGIGVQIQETDTTIRVYVTQNFC